MCGKGLGSRFLDARVTTFFTVQFLDLAQGYPNVSGLGKDFGSLKGSIQIVACKRTARFPYYWNQVVIPNKVWPVKGKERCLGFDQPPDEYGVIGYVRAGRVERETDF